MKIPARTETHGGYVYRKFDNLLIGQIGKDATGTLYGVSTRQKDVGRLYGTRMEITVQILALADEQDQLARIK